MGKCVLAISNHGTFIGGGEHSYLDLVSHLPQAFPVIACLPSEGALAKKTREQGITTMISDLPGIHPFGYQEMVRCIWRLRKICRDEQVRLIYANGSRAAFYAGLVGRLCTIPVIWHCRVSDPDPYLDMVLGWLVDRIIANSAATASRFSRHFRRKVDVIYNGFDLQWLRDPGVVKPAYIKDNWISILVVARVSRWKRHDLILSAFERMAREEENTHLMLVGGKDHADPLWWEALQAATKALPCSDRIHWIGPVEDVRPWYRMAAMMVLPSTNEPFGRVVIEAMASGVPVIATRSGGVPEIVDHGRNGMLVPENDAEALSEAIKNLLHDESLKRQLAKEGYSHADQFGIAAHVERMVHIFEDLTDNGRRA